MITKKEIIEFREHIVDKLNNANIGDSYLQYLVDTLCIVDNVFINNEFLPENAIKVLRNRELDKVNIYNLLLGDKEDEQKK